MVVVVAAVVLSWRRHVYPEIVPTCKLGRQPTPMKSPYITSLKALQEPAVASQKKLLEYEHQAASTHSKLFES